MKTKEEIITGMCITFRHDYGLLSEDERKGLWMTMKQVFENEIAPHMEMKRQKTLWEEP